MCNFVWVTLGDPMGANFSRINIEISVVKRLGTCSGARVEFADRSIAAEQYGGRNCDALMGHKGENT